MPSAVQRKYYGALQVFMTVQSQVMVAALPIILFLSAFAAAISTAILVKAPAVPGIKLHIVLSGAAVAASESIFGTFASLRQCELLLDEALAFVEALERRSALEERRRR